MPISVPWRVRAVILAVHANLDDPGTSSLWWWCPGCDDAHRIITPRWSWNRSSEAPTFSPSVLCTATWGDEFGGDRRCHCFVRDGKIQFLGDCTHRLAGQTVEMVELPEWLR